MFLAFSFTLQWSMSVGIVLGQEYLPTRIGTASGVTLGLGISVGGFAAPFLGWLADVQGLIATMYAIGAISLVALCVSAFLPAVETRVASAMRPEAAAR